MEKELIEVLNDISLDLKRLFVANKDIMNTEELSLYLGVTKEYVKQLCMRGSIPYYKNGGKNYFVKSEIDNTLIKGQRVDVKK